MSLSIPSGELLTTPDDVVQYIAQQQYDFDKTSKDSRVSPTFRITQERSGYFVTQTPPSTRGERKRFRMENYRAQPNYRHHVYPLQFGSGSSEPRNIKLIISDSSNALFKDLFERSQYAAAAEGCLTSGAACQAESRMSPPDSGIDSLHPDSTTPSPTHKGPDAESKRITIPVDDRATLEESSLKILRSNLVREYERLESSIEPIKHNSLYPELIHLNDRIREIEREASIVTHILSLQSSLKSLDEDLRPLSTHQETLDRQAAREELIHLIRQKKREMQTPNTEATNLETLRESLNLELSALQERERILLLHMEPLTSSTTDHRIQMKRHLRERIAIIDAELQSYHLKPLEEERSFLKGRIEAIKLDTSLVERVLHLTSKLESLNKELSAPTRQSKPRSELEASRQICIRLLLEAKAELLTRQPGTTNMEALKQSLDSGLSFFREREANLTAQITSLSSPTQPHLQ